MHARPNSFQWLLLQICVQLSLQRQQQSQAQRAMHTNVCSRAIINMNRGRESLLLLCGGEESCSVDPLQQSLCAMRSSFLSWSSWTIDEQSNEGTINDTAWNRRENKWFAANLTQLNKRQVKREDWSVDSQRRAMIWFLLPSTLLERVVRRARCDDAILPVIQA